jgi:phosphoglycolate phosphatase
MVTSNTRPNVERILGPESAGRIQHYECGTSMFGKASRFRRVLRRTGVPAAETICIGDELRDLDAARQVGLDFGAVAWGFAEAEALRAAGPTALFTSFGEIVERASSQPGR